MPISRSEFNYRIGQLQELVFMDATPRLAGFLQWIESDTQGAEVLQDLRNRDIQPLLDAAGFQNPPQARTPEDVAAVAVCMIDSASKQNVEIFQIGYALGVQGASSRIQDTMDEISRRYLQPLFDYLEIRFFVSSVETPAQIVEMPIPNTTDVFVVHGRDEGSKQTVARFLERLGLDPVILHEQSNRGRTIIEKFEHHAAVQFAVVILTPDDIGRLATEPEPAAAPRARQNVIFEMGYFIGRIGRAHVFPLTVGNIEIPSDYSGVLYTPMDSAGAWKANLVRELQGAGFGVDANKAFE